MANQSNSSRSTAKANRTWLPSLALRIAGRSDVNVMIGGNFGSTMLSIGSIAQRERIPHVTSTGIVDEGQRSWKYTFYTLVDFADAAKAMLAYAQKKGYKRIGIMRLEREYCELDPNSFHKFAPEFGLEVVAEERGADGDRDFTAQLTKIREANRISSSCGSPIRAVRSFSRNARQLKPQGADGRPGIDG